MAAKRIIKLIKGNDKTNLIDKLKNDLIPVISEAEAIEMLLKLAANMNHEEILEANNLYN